MTEQKTPTADERQGAEDMANAGVQAAESAEAGNRKQAAAEAMREKRDEHKLPLANEDVDRLADALVKRFDDRGAFDAPAEPVQPPEQPTAPPAPGEPAAEPAAEQPPQVPQKRSPAARFLGY